MTPHLARLPSDLAAEWLEPDGQGGFASGTVAGPRTRRYHALLQTALHPPTARMVLVNGMEAWLEAGDARVPLTAQMYEPDVMTPAVKLDILAFTLDPWPVWQIAVPGGVVSVQIAAAISAGITVLRFAAAPKLSGTLCVRLLLSGRDQHALHRCNPSFRFEADIRGGAVSWRPYATLPAISVLTNGSYVHAPEWYRNFLYTQERDRGMDCIEDLAAPGLFRFDLAAGPAVLLLRAGDGLGGRAGPWAEELLRAERDRRAAVPGPVQADAFLVDRGRGRTVVAGYPWFTDWGRDSFIALRGLAIATGRLGEARAILLEWAALVDRGMLPNRFPDDGGAPEFNAVDASLWFVIAAGDYLQAAPRDEAARNVLAAAIGAILAGYRDGTRFGIAMAPDGLIAAGQAGVQLTWMDAICDGWVVTPRIGKPVEVQALWFNALWIGAVLDGQAGWGDLAARAQASFRARFVRPDGAGLYDVVDADHVAGRLDASVRPNQIFALGGLPQPLLDGDEADAVLAIVEAELLTPLGLRTLSPKDPAYRPHYRGDRLARDGAYHQGTAWPWLLGPFVQAWLRARPPGEAACAQAATRFLAPLEAHLRGVGLGHVTEVADGDAPHTPGGCPAQAWSLGELIRIRHMLGKGPCA